MDLQLQQPLRQQQRRQQPERQQCREEGQAIAEREEEVGAGVTPLDFAKVPAAPIKTNLEFRHQRSKVIHIESRLRGRSFYEIIGSGEVPDICGRVPANVRFIKSPAHSPEYPQGYWPFVVSIGYFKNGSWVHECGGTIISRTHILTAAHCLLPKR